MSVFDKIRAGLEEAIAYGRGTLEATVHTRSMESVSGDRPVEQHSSQQNTPTS